MATFKGLQDLLLELQGYKAKVSFVGVVAEVSEHLKKTADANLDCMT